MGIIIKLLLIIVMKFTKPYYVDICEKLMMNDFEILYILEHLEIKICRTFPVSEH